MEDLVLRVIDEVALEGPKGAYCDSCTVKTRKNFARSFRTLSPVHAWADITRLPLGIEVQFSSRFMMQLTLYAYCAGCSIQLAWKLLEATYPADHAFVVSDQLKQALWGCILQRLADLKLCRLQTGSSRRHVHPMESYF
jgi:hypothetical protein